MREQSSKQRLWMRHRENEGKFSWGKKDWGAEIKIAFVHSNTGNRRTWQVCDSVQRSLPLCAEQTGSRLPLCLGTICAAARISPVNQLRRHLCKLGIRKQHFALRVNDRDDHHNCGDILHAFGSGVAA